MRIAFLSDIHANREALEAVLAHLERQRPERIIVLGDIVGYGAEPAFCIDTIRRLETAGAIVLKGNHDAAVAGANVDMPADIARAIDWTRGVLDGERLGWLAALAMHHRDEDRLYVHASAREPGAWPYITSPRDAELSLSATDARLVFSGHTHKPVIFALQPNGVCLPHVPVPREAVPLARHRRWQVVIGSVGQPRDGDPRAAYSILDLAQGALTQFRVAYDHESAARRILAAGLPERFARRLATGT